MLNDRLVHVLESRDLLSKVQCGFRKDHSTLHHLVRLETFIKKAFARIKQVLAGFFDLEKAYDTTWRKRIYTEPALHLDGQPILVKGIQGNENVGKLAKAALNNASYLGKLIFWSGLKPKVNAYIHTVWQENWYTEGANKLHEVLPDLGEDLHKRGEGAGSKRETVMCRLRVGHTWLTQSYLYKNEEQSFCYACDSLNTVRQF
ncbi:ribonuclease hi [Plakobranchus ocellatus]|uniref:Ribonuclease hi n=1 Tax=Plakobranchus ocellatus TaxID=259542 RepID=A0AAV4D063_9GAST|nr:ribonuclease hi [Plakobranchus ocellatus]